MLFSLLPLGSEPLVLENLSLIIADPCGFEVGAAGKPGAMERWIAILIELIPLVVVLVLAVAAAVDPARELWQRVESRRDSGHRVPRRAHGSRA